MRGHKRPFPNGDILQHQDGMMSKEEKLDDAKEKGDDSKSKVFE